MRDEADDANADVLRCCDKEEVFVKEGVGASKKDRNEEGVVDMPPIAKRVARSS